ncbi:MAG: hypothetical protein ACREPR_00315 [Brasilonema sp.]
MSTIGWGLNPRAEVILTPWRSNSSAPLLLADILHHSQQDLKNQVSEGKIKVFKCHHSQETRFLTLVQDISLQLAAIATSNK